MALREALRSRAAWRVLKAYARDPLFSDSDPTLSGISSRKICKAVVRLADNLVKEIDGLHDYPELRNAIYNYPPGYSMIADDARNSFFRGEDMVRRMAAAMEPKHLRKAREKVDARARFLLDDVAETDPL